MTKATGISPDDLDAAIDEEIEKSGAYGRKCKFVTLTPPEVVDAITRKLDTFTEEGKRPWKAMVRVALRYGADPALNVKNLQTHFDARHPSDR